MSRVRDVRERLHQTQDAAMAELAKLCAEYVGAGTVGSAYANYSSAADPLEFLNQFDGIKLTQFYMDGVLARDVV